MNDESVPSCGSSAWALFVAQKKGWSIDQPKGGTTLGVLKILLEALLAQLQFVLEEQDRVVTLVTEIHRW